MGAAPRIPPIPYLRTSICIMGQLGLQAQQNKRQGGDCPASPRGFTKASVPWLKPSPTMRACPGLPAQESWDSFQQYPPWVLPWRDRVRGQRNPKAPHPALM